VCDQHQDECIIQFPSGPTATISPVETLTTIKKEPTDYNLLVVKDGEEAMVISNQSPDPFPISELSFSNTKVGILNIDWGIDNLDVGDCVVLWKQTRNAKPPSEDGCNLVADVPVKPPTFWGQMIILFLDSEKIGECDKLQNECLFQFDSDGN
jgi:hypothetical protein